QMSFSLRPVRDIHLYSDQLNEHESNGNGRWLAYLFIAALFVLFMVTVNYINLQVGKAMESGREVVINRMFGATRWQFYLRFLAEALVCIVPATLLAVALSWGLFPEFAAWLGWTVTAEKFFQPSALWMILVVQLALLFDSHVYPSGSLAGRSLASGMKGKVTYSRAGMNLRRTLVGVQFFICLILFIGSAGMYSQMKFMTTLPKGFDEQNLLAVAAPGLADSLFATRHQTFVSELNRLPGVKGVTTSTEIPGKQISWAIYHLRDARTAGKEGERISVLAVDHNFIGLMGMSLLAGRDFRPWVEGQRKEVLLNRKALQVLGYRNAEDAPGRTIVNERDTFLIRGVVEDFRQEFSRRPVEPLMLLNNPLRCNYYFIRHAGQDVAGLLSRVRETWDKTFLLNPFNYYFVETVYQEQFMPDLRQERVIELFTLVTLVISSIGLFGLSAFVTSQRRREIAIRKVLGASAAANFWLLSREFFIILIIASAIAIIPSWWLLSDWRSGFPVRPDLSPMLFMIPVIVLMATGLISICWNVIRAMRVPVADVLRYE
ncbi:MAG: FtsX-like permease family protein, partial [Bacteroidota bacterium]